MTYESRYEYAKTKYAEIGVDTDKAIEALSRFPISIHCCRAMML